MYLSNLITSHDQIYREPLPVRNDKIIIDNINEKIF